MGVKFRFYVGSTAQPDEPSSRDQFLKAIFGKWGEEEWKKLNAALIAKMQLTGIEWVHPVIQRDPECDVCFVIFPAGQADYLIGSDLDQFRSIIADWGKTVEQDAHAQGWEDVTVSLLGSEQAEVPAAVGPVTDAMERAGKSVEEGAKKAIQNVVSGFQAFIRDFLMGSKVALVVGGVILIWWVVEYGAQRTTSR